MSNAPKPYDEKSTQSALLVAGLRIDPVSQAIAGEIGQELARRLTAAAPDLPRIIHARDAHIASLLQGGGEGYDQALVLGAGLDPKPVLLAETVKRWFCFDREHMLEERRRRFADALAAKKSPATFAAGDLRDENWPVALIEAGFDPEAPTFVIFEGIAMYISEDDLKPLLGKLGKLIRNPQSRLWMDHLAPALRQASDEGVQTVIATLEKGGEPLLSAFLDASPLMLNWETEIRTSAGEALQSDSFILKNYLFSILRPEQYQ